MPSRIGNDIHGQDPSEILLESNGDGVYGIPPEEILDECRAQRILTIGAATTPDEAIVLEQAGVDAIAASGFEAGGHRGSFLRPAEESLTGTFSLVPQVADPFRSLSLPQEASPTPAESSQPLR